MAIDPKVPPHDDGAEQSVIGAVLIDKDAMIDVAEFLRPEHFYILTEYHPKIQVHSAIPLFFLKCNFQ